MLRKGTLVIVSGLSSEAGQKLNDSRRIVIGSAKKSSDSLRYPVLIYASKKDSSVLVDDDEFVILDPSVKNSIKVDNLRENTTAAKKDDQTTTSEEFILREAENFLMKSDKKLFFEAAKQNIKKSFQTKDQKANVLWY